MPKTEHYKPNWLLVSKTRQVALTFIPKVMCVSLRQQFSVLDCGTTQFLQGSSETCATEARRNPQLQHLDLSNMTRVLFIRDPLERALSAYMNSNTNGYIKLPKCRNKTVCTFPQWVDEIHRNPVGAFRNEHFKTQAEIAQFPHMHYHYVLRMSSPVDQHFFWHTLLNTTAVQANPTTATTAARNQQQHTIIMKEYFESRKETVYKLADVYKDDLLLWEENLLHATPRQAGETTFFDYYKTMPP